MNDPWMAVPFEVISTTLFARTCSRKVGLYGTRTRLTSWFTNARETKKLIANSAITKKSRRQPGRWNFGGCCLAAAAARRAWTRCWCRRHSAEHSRVAHP